MKVFPQQALASFCWTPAEAHVWGWSPPLRMGHLQAQVCLCCGSKEFDILPMASVFLVPSAEAVYQFVYLKKDHTCVLFCF